MTFEQHFGLWLNGRRARALPGVVTTRAIRAAMSSHPDPLFIDAESLVGGKSVDDEVGSRTLDALEAEVIAQHSR